MKTITEAELVDNARNNAVICIKAVPVTEKTHTSGFRLFVTLKWKKGDYMLITQKGEPRVWKSPSRMLLHIETRYRLLSQLLIFLKQDDNSDGQDGIFNDSGNTESTN